MAIEAKELIREESHALGVVEEDILIGRFRRMVPVWAEHLGLSPALVEAVGRARIDWFREESGKDSSNNIIPLVINDLANLRTDLARPEAKAIPEEIVTPEPVSPSQIMPKKGGVFRRLFRRRR